MEHISDKIIDNNKQYSEATFISGIFNDTLMGTVYHSRNDEDLRLIDSGKMLRIGHFVLLIGLHCVLGLTCPDSRNCVSFVSQKDCGKNGYLEVGPPELGCCPRCGKGLGKKRTEKKTDACST